MADMKKITFTVEKSSSGYGAYANFGKHLIAYSGGITSQHD